LCGNRIGRESSNVFGGGKLNMEYIAAEFEYIGAEFLTTGRSVYDGARAMAPIIAAMWVRIRLSLDH
jgi:hypothetical protein